MHASLQTKVLLELAGNGKLSVADFDRGVVQFYLGSVDNINATLGYEPWVGLKGQTPDEFINEIPEGAVKQQMQFMQVQRVQSQKTATSRIGVAQAKLMEYAKDHQLDLREHVLPEFLDAAGKVTRVLFSNRDSSVDDIESLRTQIEQQAMKFAATKDQQKR